MKAKIGEPVCRKCGGLMEERDKEEYGRLSFLCSECGAHQINPFLKAKEKDELL